MKDDKQKNGIGLSFLALVGAFVIVKVIQSVFKKEIENFEPILPSHNSEEDETESITLKVIPEDTQTEIINSVEIPEVIENKTITLIDISEDETEIISSIVPTKKSPKELPIGTGKNSWLYPTDDFGIMQKGRVE